MLLSVELGLCFLIGGRQKTKTVISVVLFVVQAFVVFLLKVGDHMRFVKVFSGFRFCVLVG